MNEKSINRLRKHKNKKWPQQRDGDLENGIISITIRTAMHMDDCKAIFTTNLKKHLQKCHPMDYIKKILEVEEEEKQKAIQKVLKLNIIIYNIIIYQLVKLKL